jgi:hypothetical protein
MPRIVSSAGGDVRPAACETAPVAVTPGTGPHEPTRAEVRACWEDVVAGRRTRAEASDWACPWVQANFTGEELVLQGLRYLHAVDLGVDDVRERSPTSRGTWCRVLGIGRAGGHSAEPMVYES